jgi:hypothetical protein
MVGGGGREENMERDLGGLDRNSMLFSNLPRSPSPMMQRFTQPLESVDIGYQRQQVSVNACAFELLLCPSPTYSLCLYIHFVAPTYITHGHPPFTHSSWPPLRQSPMGFNFGSLSSNTLAPQPQSPTLNRLSGYSLSGYISPSLFGSSLPFQLSLSRLCARSLTSLVLR